MNPISVEFHPAAIEEAEAAVPWYAERNVRAAARFIGALEAAVAVVIQAPDRWPCFEDDTRRILLRGYPYVLIYRMFPITLRYSRCA